MLQERLGGSIEGEADTVLTGVSSLEIAQPGDLTFVEHTKHLPLVRESRASACVVSEEFPHIPTRTLWRVANPRLTFVQALYVLHPEPPIERGVHRHAVIAPDAELGDNVTIRECAVIRSRAQIGQGTVIESGVHIGERVTIGEECYLGPNVVVMADCHLGQRVRVHGGTIIGADGFGYVWEQRRHLKIPQLGNVVIEDDVELGANVCVDRATFGSTLIRRGTKIDNLVQIAHNDVVGEHVLMAAQVGIAGSSQIGDRSVLAGQSGVVNHVTIGHDVRLGAQSAAIGDLRPERTYWGTPARPIERTKRELAALALLPKLIRKLTLAAQSAARPTRRRAAR